MSPSAALSWASVALGLTAAGLWFWSTRVRHLRRRSELDRARDGDFWRTTSDPEVLEHPYKTALLQNDWNRRAAIITALSVVCQALATITAPHGP